MQRVLQDGASVAGLDRRISYLMLDKLSGRELAVVYRKASQIRQKQE